MRKGLVQVYTGKGKGKTTAALGLALRAIGQGMKVCLFQFGKRAFTGELKAAEKLGPSLQVKRFPDQYFLCKGITKEKKGKMERAGRQALREAEEVVRSGRFDMVILDEINVMLANKMICAAEVLEMINGRPQGVELVLTGRGAPAEIIRAADLVTEMRERKHPYQRGQKARRGIEY